jgi:acid-sensing ion channel, other
MLKYLMGDVDYVFNRCHHVYSSETCADMFQVVVNEGGVCYVYNALQVYRDFERTGDDIDDAWTLEGGFKNDTKPVDAYPRTGGRSAFDIIIGVYNYMNDGICKGAIQGFKVYLHMPNEVPQVSKSFFLAPYKHYTQVLISPRVTITGPELRELPVSKRQCYFSDERYLRFFRHYTQNNCEIECLANMTLSKCGCLMFFMPSKCEMIPKISFIYFYVLFYVDSLRNTRC